MVIVTPVHINASDHIKDYFMMIIILIRGWWKLKYQEKPIDLSKGTKKCTYNLYQVDRIECVPLVVIYTVHR